MLDEALRAEVDVYVAQFAGERDEGGHRLVVRNGHHEPREVLASPTATAPCSGLYQPEPRSQEGHDSRKESDHGTSGHQSRHEACVAIAGDTEST